MQRSDPAQEKNAMLVLSRKRGERIVIGPNIELTVVDVRRKTVRLAIDAPRDISIQRQEIYRRIQSESLHEAQRNGSSRN
jgi:carbon storage regulator